MTDKEKIIALCDAGEVPYLISGTHLFLAGRRFSFTKDGEICKILDLHTFEKYDDSNEYGETMRDFYSMEMNYGGQ